MTGSQLQKDEINLTLSADKEMPQKTAMMMNGNQTSTANDQC